MSADSKRPDISVQDEEEYVDKRIKKRILDAREQVDDMEHALFDEEPLMPDVQINHAQKVVAWGNTVRRFLRNIEVIMQRMDIPEAKQYLDDVDLGTVDLVPPDKDGYAFSQVAHPDLDDNDVKRLLDLPPSAELPEVQERPFVGLQSVIESEPVLTGSWLVRVGDGNPATRDIIELQTQRPVPKSLYEDAIRAADRFLFDAGVGLNIEASAWRSEEPGL